MADQVRRSFLACTRGDIAVLSSIVPDYVNPNEHIFQFIIILYGSSLMLHPGMLGCFMLQQDQKEVNVYSIYLIAEQM